MRLISCQGLCFLTEEINIENKFDPEVEEKREEAPTPLNPEEDLKPVAVTEETLRFVQSPVMLFRFCLTMFHCCLDNSNVFLCGHC
jgi:hypothetical protein